MRSRRGRPVILFDNSGVGPSTGEPPDKVKGMADQAVEFILLLGLAQVDLLGFSPGCYVAVMVTLDNPELFRRLVLAGTGPGSGEGYVPAGPDIRPATMRPILGLEEYLFLFFSPSEKAGPLHIGTGSA
jgi:pimeloyl-ACP methyl ester carboxylesterase